MGIRERLARANWELNCLFRAGRIPSARVPTPYLPQSRTFTGHQITCRGCGNKVAYGSSFCDRCGARIG